MRVTSNTYTNLVINSSQQSQQQLALLQQQISSGNSIQFASDNPVVYEQAAHTQTNLAQLQAFTAAAGQATTITSENNTAITSLHTLLSNASELAATVNGTMTTAQMQSVATQMSSLLNQLTSTVNQKSVNGTYLFGGTSDQPPIDTTTGNYNTATNAQTTSIEVQPGNNVQTGIVAGRTGVDGFLVDTASGVDVLASLKQTISDLQAGNAAAVNSTDSAALSASLGHMSKYVGSTAASMAAVSLATQNLNSQSLAAGNQLNALTQTNLPNATVQLQQIQNQYQASLEVGTRMMSLSILNYMSSIPT